MDFLIIGAMKSATSSLWAMMREHPAIYMPTGKELPFFSTADYEVGWESFAAVHLADAPAQALIGKATPHYMQGAPSGGRRIAGRDECEIPSRIARRFPEIKLIAILRDPVERAVSHYKMYRNTGQEPRGCEEAFVDLLRPEAVERVRSTGRADVDGYVVMGEYGRILSGYFEVFPARQLLVLKTESLAQDPLGSLEAVWAFLDVESHVPTDVDTRYMASDNLSWVHRLNAVADSRPGRFARRMMKRLPPVQQKRVHDWFWSAAVAAARSTKGPSAGESVTDLLGKETLGRLVDHYREDSAQLERLIGWTPLREGHWSRLVA